MPWVVCDFNCLYMYAYDKADVIRFWVGVIYDSSILYPLFTFWRGTVARSEASSLGMQAAPEFDPHVRHILSWRLGHENISTAILPLPLIQEAVVSYWWKNVH